MTARLKELFKRLHRDESGAMSVEKILILAVIALPILIVLFIFRGTIVEWFNGKASQLNDQ